MKLLAVLVMCTLVDNFIQSAPARSALIETLDGLKAKYLLMTVGPNYTTDRKPKWIIVYKNTVKKECVFREVDDSTADTIALAAEALRKKSFHFPTHLDGLLIINDANVSTFCDGFSTRYLSPKNFTSSSTSPKT